MMKHFTFPDVGEGIHEGRIVTWTVKEGDSVAVDQVIVKVETDKAVVDIPSPRAGVIEKIHAEEGATINVGDTLITFADGEEKKGGVKEKRPPAAAKPTEPPAPERPAATAGERPIATPHTRALARRLGVDLTAVKGTGKHGRITDADVERAAEKPTAPAASPPPSPPEEREERIPITHLRKVIAEAMATSSRTAAHVTHVDEADVTNLLALTADLKARRDPSAPRITLLPFFIKAIINTLKAHPIFNATYDEEKNDIIVKHYYNIGFAVDTDDGLIVPVVKAADTKSIEELSVEISDLAQRTRAREISLAELQGGTMTVTNIGPIGGLFATPIIRQPELAIVGLHTIKERPAVVDGQVVPRKMMHLSISFDHRIIDGAAAARFMNDLVEQIEHPALMMVAL